MERAQKPIITILLFVIFVLLLYISDAEANAVLQQSFQPTSINRMVSSSSLVTASTRFAGVTAANQSVYAVRAVDIGKASVANAVRTRAFTPWGLGVVAALTAAGYFLENGEYYSEQPGQHVISNCTDSVANCSRAYNDAPIGSVSYFDRFGTLYRVSVGNNPQSGVPPYVEESPNPRYSNNLTHRNHVNGYYPAIRTYEQDPEAMPDPGTVNQPLNDDQLYDVFTNLSPSQQTELLTDPLTGFPDAATIPEFQQAADSITSNWNANNDGDPATVPDPEATEQTSEEPFPEEQPEQDICKADPNILACQELGETPDETPIEEMELPIDYQPVSFSSNASCPAPTNMGGGIQYNYDGACQFASGVKPAVITMALISGIYLMGGFRR